MNPRPLGYEPSELPNCSTPRRRRKEYATSDAATNQVGRKVLVPRSFPGCKMERMDDNRQRPRRLGRTTSPDFWLIAGAVLLFLAVFIAVLID